MADAKDAVSSKVTEVIDVTKETLQSGVEAARSAVTSSVGMVMDSRVGQTAISGAEAVLGRTEDSCLPLGNEELGKGMVHVTTCNGNHQTGDDHPHSSPHCSGMGLMGRAMLEATCPRSPDTCLCGKHLWSDTVSFLSQTGSS